MKSNWKKCKISDLGTVVGGSTPSTKDDTNYGGDISWITPKDLSTFNERYIYNGERNITEKGLKSCSTQLMPKNSVLFTSRAPIGYVAIAGKEMCTNQGFKSVIPNENTDYLFLYYLLKFNKDNIENMGSGTTFKEVSGTTMKNIEVITPESKQEQQKIASILSSIDDKIELNNSLNNNLEQQAMALFNNYFPYKINDSLPENWRIGTFGEIIELHDSKRIPLSGQDRDQMQNKIYPYYGAASLMDYVDNFIFDGIYLLLGEDGTVIDNYGMPILQYVWGKFWVNNHAHILTGKNGYNVESLYLLFKQTPIKSIVTGAVQAKISQANLKALSVVIPPKDLLKEFNTKVSKLFELIRNNKDENEKLIQLRDTLLPKLMSGEIDVSNVDISTDKLSFSGTKFIYIIFKFFKIIRCFVVSCKFVFCSILQFNLQFPH